MVVTDDAEVAARVKLLRSHGMTSLTWDRYRDDAPGYDALELGFNYRIDEPRAALAMARLERLERDNEMRSAAAGRYREMISELNGVMATVPPPAGAVSANHLFTVVLDPRLDRDAIRTRLADQRVQTSIHYPPVHRLTAYRVEADLPVTEEYAGRSITLPLFPGISESQIGLVTDALRGALG
jgi:dTDP-4-amino-4,6-dideoxygalactose transaminase